MATFLITAFTITALTVTSYGVSEGFMGIPWGANAEQVRQGMTQNGFSLHNEEKWGVLTQAVFENGSYALLQGKYGIPEGETQSWANNRPSTGVKVTSTTWLIPNEGKKPNEISLSKTPVWYLGKLRMGGVSVSYSNIVLEEELDNRERQNI